MMQFHHYYVAFHGERFNLFCLCFSYKDCIVLDVDEGDEGDKSVILEGKW